MRCSEAQARIREFIKSLGPIEPEPVNVSATDGKPDYYICAGCHGQFPHEQPSVGESDG